MKRVLLLTDSLGAGGAQRQLVGLAIMLKNRGYNVKVVSYLNHSFYKSMLIDNEVNFECLDIDSKLCLFKLIRVIRKYKPDVMVSYQTIPNILACIAATITHVKLIVSERNTHQALGFNDKIAFALYRLADWIVPNSYSEQKFITKNYKELAYKTITISNFVDLSHFYPGNHELKRPTRILVVASVKASKNTKDFIRAFKKAKDKGCNAIVEWYGINPIETEILEYVHYTEECVSLIKHLGLEKDFYLLPKRKDIDIAYREADIFCLPSFFEGTPNVICEAMSCGLPILCSAVCDNPFIIKHNVNGLLFDPLNVYDIADKLYSFINLPLVEKNKMSLKNREDAISKFSSERFIGQYLTLLNITH